MAYLNESAETLLATVDEIDLNDETQTTLYTVPIGKKAILTKAILHTLSDDSSSLVLSIGRNGAVTDFLGAQTTAACNDAGSVGVLAPVPNATTVEHFEYAAAVVIEVDVATAAGEACTGSISLFGILIDV